MITPQTISFSPMAEPNSMKIIEISKVIPPNSPSQFSLPLTFLDRIWLQTNPTSRLFFYHFPEPNTDFLLTILPRLKHSLSRSLEHYLPLAGNLSWPQDSKLPVVHYKAGDGISLTVAETLADYDYLSGNNFREASELRSLLPDFPSSEIIYPAMALKVTLFPKKGFSIAYVAHHAIMDGKSTSMFLHSWAYFCRNGNDSDLPLELIPCFDRSFVENQMELEKVYPKGWGPIDLESKALKFYDMTPPEDMALGTFILTKENIEFLKNKAKSIGTPLSTFTVTSAFIGLCLIKAKKVTADLTYLGFSVDCRARLDPPLPPTYFGNCIVVIGGGRDTNDYFERDGFLTAVKIVTEAVEKFHEGVLKVVEGLSKVVSTNTTKAKTFAGFTIGGSPRFELYKLDFGWGKPIKTEMISIDKGQAFYLSDDRDCNGGIEIGVALKKDETEAFASMFADGLEAC